MLTGFPTVCRPSLATRTCLVRNFTSHLRPHGAEPRRVLPLHCAQECGAGLVVEGDDDTGGWQVRGIGQGWATGKRAGSQRQAGAGNTLRQLSAFLYPLGCALGQLYKVQKKTARLPRHDAPSHRDPAPTCCPAWDPGRKQQIEGVSQVWEGVLHQRSKAFWGGIRFRCRSQDTGAK